MIFIYVIILIFLKTPTNDNVGNQFSRGDGDDLNRWRC